MVQINEKIRKLSVSPFTCFSEQWAVVTAGTKDSFNCMTISWGGLGTLWSKPVASVYIKPVRYTYTYMESNEFFTVCFFDEKFREDLKVLGTTSGKDADKLSLTKLDPIELEHGISYAQAKLTIVCRKIYAQDFNPDSIPQAAKERFYTAEAPHRQYIGEVVDIIEKE